ncbi:hypothetical protein PC128_g18444 [Phytophthora cactorum]|nr:hypothetical protein PC121_g18406 [Phytophthora cactorum]KAG3172779.1 hypothetical protein PC128_g18444 [Phytophthora cactorum]KAG4045757.1 hypothetical protein PC123_g18851 [Phytophthora cactorum]
MELSQLRFKVYRKAGTAMGHAGVILRLYSATVNALTIEDLLNKTDAIEDDSPTKRTLELTSPSEPAQKKEARAPSKS